MRDVLQLQEVPDPELRPTDLLVKVAAAGVNRADFGDSHLIGLEMAGEVIAGGADVPGYKVDDHVMGIRRRG